MSAEAARADQREAGASAAGEGEGVDRRDARASDVTLLGWVGIVGGFAQLAYVGLPLLGIGSLGTSVTFESADGAALFGVVVSLAIAAAAAIVFGILALRGDRHAWRIGIIVFAFNVAWSFMAVFTVAMVPAALALIASIGLVVYLGARPVRESFGVEGDITEALWYRR